MVIKVVSEQEVQRVVLSVEGSPEALKTLLNLLGAIQWCCSEGHSACLGATFDGDGSDFIRIRGLPKNDGPEQAAACFDYGDGLLAEIGAYSAYANSSRYTELDGEDVRVLHRTKVWPSIEHKE